MTNSSSSNSTGGSTLDLSLNLLEINNHFVLYASALLLLAYCLSLGVSYLHKRKNSLVFPLTAAEPISQFTEYIILIKTSVRLGSSLDPRGRVCLQLKGNFGDSPKLLLKKGKNVEFFLCRGGVNIFVYHSPTDLGDIIEVEIDLFNDFPYEIPFVKWRPCFIRVLQPFSRKFWGCTIRALLKSQEKYTCGFPCIERKRDRNGILKSLCVFHLWFCMFHCPVRLGMYTTLVHTVLMFFIGACLLFGLTVCYKLTNQDDYQYGSAVLGCVLVVEVISEAFLRNTLSRFRVMKDSLFSGLVEPVESAYDANNFTLDYNWDNVKRPLVGRQKVILATGSRHGSAFSIFHASVPLCMSNMWGLFDEEQEKETNVMIQILNTCSLPLPATKKWLAIEATGRKEEVLIEQAMSNYKHPFCVFDTWLLDWPSGYAEEPYVAGLIMSHIMSNDLLMLLKIKSERRRAHMAQLCVHQWHGLICCLFLYSILFNAEDNKLNSGQIKTFIFNTLTCFGKRKPREIKSSWIKRAELKEHFHLRHSMTRNLTQVYSNSKEGLQQASFDENTSSKFCEQGLPPRAISMSFEKLSDSEESVFGSKCVLQDTLIFDDDLKFDSMPNVDVKCFDTRSSNFESGDSNTVGQINIEQDSKTMVSPRSAEGEWDTQQKTVRVRDCNTNADMAEEEENEEFLDAEDNEPVRKEEMLLGDYEQEFLGPPYLTKCEPEFVAESMYKRCCDEISAYCCSKKRCKLFREIHHKVGDPALEILKTIVEDLQIYSEVKHKSHHSQKIWKRKKMVEKMIKDMNKKARLYDDSSFEENVVSDSKGFNCNKNLTAIFNSLRDFIDNLSFVEEESEEIVVQESRKKRCIFCAKPLDPPYLDPCDGCDDLKKLVNFFTKGTIYVAEKELNMQLVSRYTVQNYCATILCQAREEVSFEMEDPPLVMASHVLQAMLHFLLTNLLPKQTDFNALTADELRKLGTRLQRIKARYVTSDKEKNRSREEKRKLEKIKHLITELGTRWRLQSNSNALTTNSQLMARCLVQERLLGLSVYSGFISKDHEVLLNGDVERLIEMEKKASSAVLKIARKVCEPIVRDILDDHQNIDVIFSEKNRELNYLVEKLHIAQYNVEPLFLSTCCYYVADIVKIKIREFKHIMKYMKQYKPAENSDKNLIPKNDRPFKFTGEIKLLKGYTHADVCSPVLRWGNVALKGEPPLSAEYVPNKYDDNATGDQILEIFENHDVVTEDDKIVAALIGARRGMENFAKSEEYEKEKHLQQHLARVQAHLLDQLADGAQSITQITALDKDYVSEFHQDQLYTVELYASNKLNLYIHNLFGIIFVMLMIIATILFMIVVCFQGTAMEVSEVKKWALFCLVFVVAYGFVMQPLKCLMYSLLRLYVD